MDERTAILICLGAATAANCIPCFEHFFKKAEALSLTEEDIQEAVDLAYKVKSGAQIAMRGSIGSIMGPKTQEAPSCCEKPDGSCCD